MLSLKVNGEAVDLPDDFSVTSNLKSPIFNEIGSYSYPFKFRNTPRNARIIGFLHRQEGIRDPFVSAPSQLLWNGNLLEETEIKYSQIDSSIIEGTMLQAEGSFFNAIKERMMRAVNTGEFIFPSEFNAIDYINYCNGRYYPEVNVAFPKIQNLDYFDPVTEDPQQQYFNYHKADNRIYAFTDLANRTVIVPFVFLRHVLMSVFKDAGYKLTDYMFSKHADYNKLVVYNSLTCNSLMTDFTYTLLDIFTSLHLPNNKVTEFLTGIETHFNCRFFVDNLMKQARCISVDDILKSSDYIEFSDRIEKISLDLTNQKTGFLFQMELDSDDTVVEELTDLEDRHTDFIRPSVPTLYDLPQFPNAEIGEIRSVEAQGNMYYKLQTNKQWIAIPQIFQDVFSQFFFRDFSEKVDSKFSTLANPGNAYEVKCGNKMASWKDATPRVFFVVKDTYYGSNNMIGRNQTSAFSLNFNQSNNIFDTHYKTYFNWFIQTRPVKIVKQMTFEEIRSLDFSRKYRINGMDYLIKTVRVTFTKDRIKPATLELYKV